mmetsp:Transcript_17150/g.42573  ORF Transcript_17150/g.42573 Transcript_17150/m.42573 type:complete len:240 (+) Transcript_17150:1273-1992(+)
MNQNLLPQIIAVVVLAVNLTELPFQQVGAVVQQVVGVAGVCVPFDHVALRVVEVEQFVKTEPRHAIVLDHAEALLAVDVDLLVVLERLVEGDHVELFPELHLLHQRLLHGLRADLIHLMLVGVRIDVTILRELFGGVALGRLVVGVAVEHRGTLFFLDVDAVLDQVLRDSRRDSVRLPLLLVHVHVVIKRRRGRVHRKEARLRTQLIEFRRHDFCLEVPAELEVVHLVQDFHLDLELFR